MVQADSGAIGGDESAEFMVLADSGEDTILECKSRGIASNVEALAVRPSSYEKSTDTFPEIKKVHTPDLRRIEDVSSFLKVKPLIY